MKLDSRKPIRRVHVHAHHVHWVRGLLIARLRRDIKWKEFYALTNTDERYMQYIKIGTQVGGRQVASRLINSAREHGVVIHLSDFFDDDPNPVLPRMTRPLKRRTP